MLRIIDINAPKEVNPMNHNRVQAAKQALQAHRENIEKNIEHRLQIAKSKGDEQLIRQLEAELTECS
jgi:hypothetical protein